MCHMLNNYDDKFKSWAAQDEVAWCLQRLGFHCIHIASICYKDEYEVNTTGYGVHA